MCTSQSTNFLLQKEKVLLIFLRSTTTPYLITNWCDPFQLSLAVEVHIIDMVLLNTLLYVQCGAKVVTIQYLFYSSQRHYLISCGPQLTF